LISIVLCLKNNLVDTMLNPSRKKIVRVDIMPNSLLREINNLRRRYNSLVAGKHYASCYDCSIVHIANLI